MEGRGHLLRRPADRVRPAGLRRPTASTRSWRCSTGQVRHVDRRHRRRRPSSPTPTNARWPTRSASRRRRTAVVEQGRQLAVGLGACDPGRHPESGRRQELHRVGDVEGLRRARAAKEGWADVPTGTRTSTYENPEFLKAAVSPRDAGHRSSRPIRPTRPSIRCPTSVCSSWPSPSSRASAPTVSQEISAAYAGQDDRRGGAGKRRRRSPTARCEAARLLSPPPRPGRPAQAALWPDMYVVCASALYDGARGPGPSTEEACPMATKHSRAAARLMMAPAVTLLLGWMLIPLSMTIYLFVPAIQPASRRPDIRRNGSASRTTCCSSPTPTFWRRCVQHAAAGRWRAPDHRDLAASLLRPAPEPGRCAGRASCASW